MSSTDWKDNRTTSISPIVLGQHAKKKQIIEQIKIDMVNQNLKNVIDEQKKSLANSRDMVTQGRGQQLGFSRQRKSVKNSGQYPDHKIGTIIEDPVRDSVAMNS